MHIQCTATSKGTQKEQGAKVRSCSTMDVVRTRVWTTRVCHTQH